MASTPSSRPISCNDSFAPFFHVNETGYFAKSTGRFKNALGRFNLQGPFGWGVKLPDNVHPGANDGLFWIGQYVGSICGVKEFPIWRY